MDNTNTMKILFLDDQLNRWDAFREKNPTADATWASSYYDAVTLIEKNEYDLIYLDHDLGTKATGHTFAQYMVEKHVPCRFVVCHSMNHVGRVDMTSLLHGSGFNVLNCPYAWEYTTNQVVSQMDDSY